MEINYGEKNNALYLEARAIFGSTFQKAGDCKAQADEAYARAMAAEQEGDPELAEEEMEKSRTHTLDSNFYRYAAENMVAGWCVAKGAEYTP